MDLNLQDKRLKFLVIQTAFIGDVILATPVIEKLHQYFPEGEIDFLLRKGNESLFKNHPFLNDILIWNKKENKHKNLLQLIRRIRKKQYDYVINLQRFFSTGLISACSGAKYIIGFDKNPLSYSFTEKLPHKIGTDKNFIHEVDRNLSLIEKLTDGKRLQPKLYPDTQVYKKINPPQQYICIAPTSVWFTKQWPAEKWVELIDRFDGSLNLYLLGAPSDKAACEEIKLATQHPSVINLAGQLSLLESAALMKNAKMNFVNDSAPLHFASAVDAPVTSIFCSTVPRFGFTPLSSKSIVIETNKELPCRPCGLHGFTKCPEGHFKCSDIKIKKILEKIEL